MLCGPFRAIVGFVGMAMLTPLASPADAGEIRVSVAGMRANMPVVSLKEARFETVISQQYDFSCGSAALATLLTYHYDRPTSEAEAFEAMYTVGDKQTIEEQGFSLLDMKKFLNAMGVRADGFQLTLDQAAQVGLPGIMLINTNGYLHFVVLKGIRGNEVVVGDPALGTKVMTREKLSSMWEGVIFFLRDKTEIGKERFNLKEDWAVRAKAPFGDSLNRRSLSGYTLMLRQPNEF